MQCLFRTKSIQGVRNFLMVIVIGCALLFWSHHLMTSKLFHQTATQPLTSDLRTMSDDLDDSLARHIPNNAKYRDQWIVVDALTSSCDDVTNLTRQEEWSVLVVTDDEKNILGCRLPKCVQLTWRDCQKELGHLATLRALGAPSKLFGYLLAIMKGAEVIVDADCNTAVENLSISFFTSEFDQSGLFYNDTTLFNPYHHWGYVNAYPKQFFDFTDQQLENISNSDRFYVVDRKNVWIRQGVILSESTCFQSTHLEQTDTIISQGSPVFIGGRTLAPMNTGPTLFYKQSFMWMFQPPDVVTTVSQFFRTLWLHQLGKMSLVTLSYYDLTPRESTNLKPRGGTCDLFNTSSSKPLKYDYWDCLPVLKCPQGDDFIKCSFALAQEVISCLNTNSVHASNETQLYEIIMAWENDLRELGASPRLDRISVNTNIFKIRYGVPRQHLHLASQTMVNDSIIGNFQSLCDQSDSTVAQYLKHSYSPIIDDILLIIVINYESLFKTLPYMEFIHRQYFKHMIYCGPSLDQFIQYANTLGLTYVTYIEGMTYSWYFMYECVTHAMKLRLPVRGYLQIGEDVLLNSWNLNRLPRDTFWFPKQFTKLHLYQPRPEYPWVHWNHPFGQEAIVNVFSDLKNASSLPPTQDLNKRFHRFAKKFLENYASNFDSNFILYGGTDIFYIPEILRNDYILASEFFRQHQVLTEIAVPVLHLGLVKKDQVTYIKGDGLWGNDRINPWNFFNASHNIFIHPFKLFSHALTEVGNYFYCKIFMDVYKSFL